MKKFLVLGIIALFAVSLLGLSGQDIKYPLGGKVTSLTLMEFDLEKTLAKEDVKGVVFVFLSYTCPASIACDGRYISYADDFKKKGILLYGIDANMRTENAADMKAYAKKKDYTFPVLWDEGNVIADRFDARTTPHAFFVDKKSVLRYKGRIDDSTNNPSGVKETFLANVISEYLAGKELSVTETRPDG